MVLPMFRKGLRKLGRAVKRVFRKRPARRQKSNVNNGLLHVKKTIIDARVNVVSGTTIFGVDTFELNDIPQMTDYRQIYEEYRIDKIVYTFNSLTNMATPQVGIGYATLGMIHSVVDNNDATAPTSIQTMMNDSLYRGSRSSKNHVRVFRPKWLNQVAGGAVQPKGGWLLTDSPNVSHYGLKYALEGGNASTPSTSFFVEPIVTYYISFKNPK